VPFGKDRSDFNPTLRNKFCEFVDLLHKKDVVFMNKDFRELKIASLNDSDFVYCDPPYLNTTANYNEHGGWTEKEELDLLEMLNELNRSNIKFALSNNLSANTKLEEWANDSGYIINDLSGNYSNCNYQKKDKSKACREVLITNYN
jgi:site-specific DNA-adenine methylase